MRIDSYSNQFYAASKMFVSKRTLKIVSATAVGLGTLASLRANEYDFGAIGIVRLSRAASTAFVIGSHYEKHLYRSGFDRNSEEYQLRKSEAHAFGAQKLLELCSANKGVYIKVGQHIGALDYLLPKEYVQTLKILHSSAPQSSFNDVLTVLKEDFKKNPYEIFESIEQTPLGTASLAQVHRATLKNGIEVAVKVQHRAVKTNSYVDIKTMSALVKITSWIFPDFKFDWLVDETKKNIPQELNFTQEGKNAEKVSQLFKDYKWLHIPKIYWNISSNRVLTMEFIEGGQVNDLKYYREHKINPYDISNKIGSLYSHMIFITGFVHSDPHPGNIIVRKKNNEVQVVLLDHGLYAELSNEFRWEYSKLWLAILNSDKIAMQRHCDKLGVGDMYGLLACMVAGRTWDTLMSGIQKTKYTKGEKELFQKEIPDLLPKITEVLERVNRHMLLVLKTNDLIRSIEYNLNTQARMSAFLQMSTCCIKSVYGEKFRNCNSKWSRCLISLQEHWSLFKVVIYYTYLGMINFSLKDFIFSFYKEEIELV
ncbi:aarF domain-containing kinase 1 [Phymastichus coffea]|uniref:aarF domain-containing kinase 1 n=1 Tax=Phymastichus coffea TaxID=108790 RepID=UPI00273B028D|nr:aarF domain-containing kinase 1 [Phymastichus coffea]XP_058809967.1 aarF domain-containing kinase 1 [Phymastichus coffea]XP_058809968.1 aarF domain-containing kinase 1 [Phymastichus coffea]XP_058809969.1 aarF domain-containing kinase 1 [Phymastichus coffea]XP_058809970.1 aarF domain-containing kinase 1 [Phymastichus coffea]